MIHIAECTEEWAIEKHLQIFYSPSMDSTNTRAKKEGLISSTSPWIYLTAEQTDGRGRGHNLWLNTKEPGHQLLCTWCYELKAAPQPISVPLFGWAVYQALNDEFDMSLSIKAPNDIWSGSKKFAGILIESVSQGPKHAIFVGLGLNVYSSPKELTQVTSLGEEIGFEITKDRWKSFLGKLKNRFEQAVTECVKPELSAEYRSEILAALKKWPNNNIEKFMSNGDLILKDSKRIAWMDL